MKTRILPLIVAAFIASLCAPLQAGDLEPLPTKIPPRSFSAWTPEPHPNIEPLLSKPPKPFMAPKGVVNVALGKQVTASVSSNITGKLEQVTDGKNGGFEDYVVMMKKGLQWVQIDLGKEYEVAAIAIWHDHSYYFAYHDVILQGSNDPTFATNVVTLFNNDSDNSAGRGLGKDKEYWEQNYGRVIDGKMTKARYVRSYTNGSTSAGLNSITEIEVYALP